MNVLHNRIVVKFDENHNRIIKLGKLELIRAEEWLHKADDGSGISSTYEENTNYIETKPQIATVMQTNSRYPQYKIGDVLFLHYMAHTTATYANERNKEAYISSEFVFFKIGEQGAIAMVDDMYLGEQVEEPEEVTASGIILMAGRQRSCHIKLLHLPTGSPFRIGNVIATCDNYQYKFTYNGKEYVMVRTREIVAILESA